MHPGGSAEEPGQPAVPPTVADVLDLESTSSRTIVDLRGSGPFLAAGRYRYLAARDALPLQLHSRLFVIAIAVRSGFDFVVNGQIARIDSGEAILIPPGSVYTTGIDAQTPGELIWLVVESGAADDEPTDAGPPARRLVAELLAHGVTTCRSPRLSVDLLSRVVADPGAGADAAVWRESLCTAALAELSRALRTAKPNPAPLHPGLRRALARAADRIDDPVSVADLIESSGISPTRFYELFASAYGTNPKDYLLRMKIERATELLRTTDASVTDLAHRLGFSSSQHFGTVFRRYLGTSPSAYRAQHPSD